MLIRVTDSEAECLAAILEYGAQEGHALTLDMADPFAREEGEHMLRTALRLLAEIEPDAALLDAGIEPGAPFDWDAFYADDDQADADEESETASLGDESASPA